MIISLCPVFQRYAFADIPSGKGENSLSIGTGITSFLNGSINTFYPINNQFGIGLGISGHYQIVDYYYQYVGLIRIYDSKESTICLFYEQGRLKGGWNESAENSAIGIGLSKFYKMNKIDFAVSALNGAPSHFGLGTGIKLTKESGTFYEVTLLDKLPTFIIGKTHAFTEAFGEDNKATSNKNKK